MSLARYRNKYTLSNKRHRPPIDLFEKDPFKIHSFNFHYAERPATLPMPNFQQRVKSSSTLEDFATCFYNRNFSTTGNLQATSSKAIDKRLSKLQKFQEYRKRKLLNSFVSDKNGRLPQIKESSLNSQSDFVPSNILTSSSYNGNVKLLENRAFKENNGYTASCSLASKITQAGITSGDMKADNSKSTLLNLNTSSSATLKNNQSNLNSGYEININIKGLENKSPHENMNIKIENDSTYKNLNIPLIKNSRYSLERLDTSAPLQASNTINLNKRLSKLVTNENKPNDFKKSENERQKELSSIYSSSKLSKSSRVYSHKSTERLPSLIPFKTHNYKTQDSDYSRHNLTSKQSLMQRVKDNLKVYDSRASRKKSSQNNLSGKYYTTNYGGKPSLSSSSAQRNGSNFKIRNNERLPLNININVYADNLKLLKV